MEIDDREVILKEIHRRLPKCPACDMKYSKINLDSNIVIPMLHTKDMPFSSIHIEEAVIKIRLYYLNADVDLFSSPDPIQEVIDLVQEK